MKMNKVALALLVFPFCAFEVQAKSIVESTEQGVSIFHDWESLKGDYGEEYLGGWGAPESALLRIGKCVVRTPSTYAVGPASVSATLSYKPAWGGWLKDPSEPPQTGLFNVRLAYSDADGDAHYQTMTAPLAGVDLVPLGTHPVYGTYFQTSPDVRFRTLTLRFDRVEHADRLHVEICEVYSGAGLSVESLLLETRNLGAKSEAEADHRSPAEN